MKEYLGQLEARAKLVQPGTRWKPRRSDTKGLSDVVVKSRHSVEGQGALQDRIYLDRIEGTGKARSHRLPNKSASMSSFLGAYMREDEKVGTPTTPAARPNQITSRLDDLEGRLARLEKELGVIKS